MCTLLTSPAWQTKPWALSGGTCVSAARWKQQLQSSCETPPGFCQSCIGPLHHQLQWLHWESPEEDGPEQDGPTTSQRPVWLPYLKSWTGHWCSQEERRPVSAHCTSSGMVCWRSTLSMFQQLGTRRRATARPTHAALMFPTTGPSQSPLCWWHRWLSRRGRRIGKISGASRQSFHSLWHGDQCWEDQADDKRHQCNTEIKVNGQKLETVTSFKYLGSVITDGGSKPEILSRIA